MLTITAYNIKIISRDFLFEVYVMDNDEIYLIVRVACKDCNWVLHPDDMKPPGTKGQRFVDPEISNEYCREKAREHSRKTRHAVGLTKLG